MFAFLILLFVLGTVLAACGGGEDAASEEPDDGADDQAEEQETETDDGEAEEEETQTEGPQMGGDIVGAMDTAPAGVFNPIFYEEAYEANILNFTHEALLSQDDELQFQPNLAYDWEIN